MAISSNQLPDYYDPNDPYVPPSGGVSYKFGTWRWRFGSFSQRRGWPQCGVVYNERLIVAKDSTLYGSVVGDFTDFSTYNEVGEISADMAFIHTIKDPNGILNLDAGNDLLAMTPSGPFAILQRNPAEAFGPGNVRSVRQNSEGASDAPMADIDGRTIYIGKSRRRVIELEYEAGRNRQTPIDLSRYARHIGKPRFLDLVSQKDPNRLFWTRRGDGTLSVAVYNPDEQALGWATRPMAEGCAVASIAGITDPMGELDQLWAAVTFRGSWHICRLDQLRQEDDDDDPAMTDMAAVYEGSPASTFGPVPWLSGLTIQVQGDDAAYDGVQVDGAGMFTLPNPHSRVIAGLPFPCRFTTLPLEAGGDNGPAMGKVKRFSRFLINVLKTRGLRVTAQGAPPVTLEQLTADSVTNAGFVPDTGLLVTEDVGTDDIMGQVTVERYLPQGATIRAIQPTADVSQR
ncbi:hypothetical protein [Stakelama pacifica]|uniref:Uncharacterized protein n=1 Tax=Stakelama pacifica TaxID=517720 RepID=A0A4R6FN54_9SPHN|nr:hypothetical protein [Stakelama pacifica]TDN82973.1 hypothetical protein EV664_105171 [Stakelama pacifica]GGO95036.1 hypothetical protein GCM10011329_18270 [Stakelama pacifica]